MKWEDRQGSSNIGIGGAAAGGGIGTLILGGILWLVFGMDPMTAMQTSRAVTGAGSQQTRPLDNENATRDQRFASVVLADTEAVWQQVIAENGAQYREPKMILFLSLIHI